VQQNVYHVPGFLLGKDIAAADGYFGSEGMLLKVGRAVLLLALACALVSCLPTAEGKPPPEQKDEEPERPNVILILTDDLAAEDLSPEMLEQMPNLREEVIEKGTTFENAFVTNPLCCPSRATTLRGQYTHNHQILSNAPPLGGAERFRISGGGLPSAVGRQETSAQRRTSKRTIRPTLRNILSDLPSSKVNLSPIARPRGREYSVFVPFGSPAHAPRESGPSQD